MIYPINTYQPISIHFPVPTQIPLYSSGYQAFSSPMAYSPFHAYYLPPQYSPPAATNQQVPRPLADSESEETSDETLKKVFPISSTKPTNIEHAARPVYPAIEYQGWSNPIERELQRLRQHVRILEDQLYRLQRKFKQMSRSRSKRTTITRTESSRHTPIVLEFTRKLSKIPSEPSSSTKVSSSAETPMSTEFLTNPNFNQSNNNDLRSDDDDDDDDDAAEMILDAFERSYLSRLQLQKQPMKVKYIPKERSFTWPNRKTFLNHHQLFR